MDQIKTAGSMTLEFFPPGFLALQKELSTGFHPKLEEILSNYPPDEIDMKLARIASYAAVMLDGTYTLEERDKLCYILVGRLEVMREIPK